MTGNIAAVFDESNFDQMRVCAIGAGSMGPGTALAFAEKGCAVSLFVRSEQGKADALAAINAALHAKVKHGLLAESAVPGIVATIAFFVGSKTDPEANSAALRAAATGADIVIESIAEDLKLKQDLFTELNAYCPAHTVFATNTSALDPTDIVAHLPESRQQNVLSLHFWNPPHLLRLVEVVPGEQTAPEVTAFGQRLMAWLGKKPVPMAHAIPGFIGNRLQMALLKQALHLLATGKGTAEEIDAAVEKSFGITWATSGPMAEALAEEPVALEHHMHSAAPFLFSDSDMPPLLEAKFAAGHFGAKTATADAPSQGIYAWSAKEVADLRQHREAHIVKCLKAKLLAEAGEVPEDADAFATPTAEEQDELANIMRVAVLREALYILRIGAATANDIDAVITETLGIRLAITGPLKSANLGGLDIFHSIHESVGHNLCIDDDVAAMAESARIAGTFDAQAMERAALARPETVPGARVEPVTPARPAPVS